VSGRARLLLLLALSGGALLVGIELLITAVALPSIVADLADWTQLRRASWVVNAYLLAYIAAMPLAGRAADRFGLPRLFMLALGTFALGSALSGAAQTLDQLIAARVIQGIGGGAVVPLATAGASLLYDGHGRARALGVVGACTFLGMAIGPFAGATVLQVFDFAPAFGGAGSSGSLAATLLTPSWRWIFYLGAPLAVMALLFVWAAAPQWRSQRQSGSLDALGAGLFTATVAAGLLALTTLGEAEAVAPAPGAPPQEASVFGPALYGVIAAVCGVAAIARFARARDPFLDVRAFRSRVFSSAVLVSLLTGYGLATAIIGAAVFVDRVRYAGSDEQRLVLGGLALATAVGALVSGFALRVVGLVVLSLLGLALAVGGLLLLAGLVPGSPLSTLLIGVVLFGLGFGLTVTPRSTAAVEALGRRAFGMASAGVTVARMAGMAVGLAVLTGLGSNRIQALSVVLTDQAARDRVLPVALQGRPLQDGLVVDALERWASNEAAAILTGLFLIAAVVMIVAVLPTLAMHSNATGRSGHATISAADGPSSGEQGDETGTRSAGAF
jgi:MFS family permease